MTLYKLVYIGTSEYLAFHIWIAVDSYSVNGLVYQSANRFSIHLQIHEILTALL